MLVNGTPQHYINLDERALAYGDGVFETIRLFEGKAILLEQHLQRLETACETLGINCDFNKLHNEIELLEQQFTNYGVLKIVLSRGQGGRGYRPDPEIEATRILTLHALPKLDDFDAATGVAVFMCKQDLSRQQSLAGIKHLNRLEQVLAASEWAEDRFFEGLMCDTDKNIIEGTRTNLFYAANNKLRTPALNYAGVKGILRQLILEKIPKEAIIEENVKLEQLLQADEIFLCNSVIGIWPVKELITANKSYYFSSGRFGDLAKQIFREALGSFK